MNVPFNKLTLAGSEFDNMRKAFDSNFLQGDGSFTKKCHALLAEITSCQTPLLTSSGTSSLEMAALLCDIKPGDEVIVPSYTFVSTASAFALRGAKIAWCDSRPDTLNMDETLLEGLVSEKTKAVVPVHYAGVPCEMDAVLKFAKKYNLKVVEDAAQGMCAYYKGRHLGTLGDFGALSFHGTKNITCGEGGAILVNSKSDEFKAYVVREKGTNRTDFIKGKADKYTWVDLGSSFLPSEISAAYLLAQLEKAHEITKRRVAAWNVYYEALAGLEGAKMLQRPTVPEGCEHNAHIFYFLANTASDAKKIFAYFKQNQIAASSHYQPLHASPMGRRLSEYKELPVCESFAGRLVRLPIYADITAEEQAYVVQKLTEALS